MDDPSPRSRRSATTRALSLADAARAGAWSRELRERLSEPRGDVSLSIAMRELGAVHRGEQARLLCTASRLRCEATPIGCLFLELRARTVPHERWRAQAVEEIDACWLDGWEPSERLSQCVSRPRSAWPPARELSGAAHELEPSLSTRLHRARAELCADDLSCAGDLLCAGNPVRAGDLLRAGDELSAGGSAIALDMMHRLLRAPLAPSERREVLEGLALACEACGRFRDAREHHAASCREFGDSAAAFAAWLALTLATGAVVGVEATRKRHAARGASRGWGAADEQRLRGRIRHQREAGRWSLSEGARRCAREWLEHDDAILRSVAAAALST
jgi:hypothetical protein